MSRSLRSRRVLVRLTVIASVACLLAVVALIAVHTAPVRRIVAARIATLLARQQIHFSAGDLRYNLLNASVALTDVRIGSTTSHEPSLLATIGRARIDVSLVQLLRGRYVVQAGSLEDVDVHYLVNARGEDNLPRPASGPETPRPAFDVFVSSFSIANARLRYENRLRNIDARLPLQSIEVRGDERNGRQSIVFTGAGGAVTFRDYTTAIDRLQGRAALGRDDLRIDRIGIDSSESHVDIGGVVDLSTQLADVSSFRLRAPWGDVTGRGRVTLDGSGLSSVTADLIDVDAAGVMRSLRLPSVAATRIDGTLQAEWPGLDVLSAKGSAEATLRSTTAKASRSAIPISGRLVGRGEGGRLSAQLLQLELPGAEVNGTVAVTSDRRLEGEVAGQSSDIGQLIFSIESLTGHANGAELRVPVGGPANFKAGLAGSLDSPTATTAFTAPALQIGDVHGIAIKAQASYAARTVTVSHADLIWQHTQARLDGHVGIGDDQPIDLSLTANDVEVETLLRAMNQTGIPIAGTLTGKGTVRGTLSNPDVTFAAEGSNLVAYGEELGSLTATVQLTGDQLAVPDLVINKPQPDRAGRLSASGTYDLKLKTYTFDVQSNGLQLLGLVLPDGRRVRGNIELLKARGAGSLDRPEATADLDISGLEIDSPDQTTTELGGVALNVVAKNGEATIDASADQLNLDAHAIVGVASPWPATLMLRASDLDLAGSPLRAAFGMAPEALAGLAGELRATVEASGDLSDPARGQATMTLDALRGSWNGRPFTVSSASPLRYAGERVAIDTLRVEGLDSSLTISGDLPLADQTASGEISVDLNGTLAALTQYAPRDLNLSGDGALTMTGSVRGTLARVEPDLTVTIDRGVFVSPSLQPGLSDIVLRARIESGAAEIDQLDARWGTAMLQASGRIPLDAAGLPFHIPHGSGPAAIKAVLSGLDPSSIPGIPAQVSGRVSAEADLTATSADLGAVNGRVVFQELDMTLGGLDLSQQEPTTLTIGSGAATVDRFALSGSAGTITVGGRVGLNADRALDLNVDGTLNVAALSVLTGQIRTEGNATLKLAAQGTLTSPALTGTIDLMDGTAVTNEPRIAAENINVHLDLAGRRMSLTRFEADVNGGTVNASGTLTLGERFVREVDLEIAAKEVAFDGPVNIRSVSNATLRLGRSGDVIVAKGKVTIEEAGLTDDINLNAGLLARIAARRNRDLTERRDTWLGQLRFDIDVATATPMLVDNNLARAEIDTELHVVGTPYEPGLLGTLTLEEGSEILLNERRYQVERGVISFADERRILPSFDLRLFTRVSDYDVTLVVTGAAGSTETTLTSVPSRPEPDILAMLVTGRTLDEMRGEEFEVARDQVLSSLAGRLGSSLGRGLQQATPLSEVRIEPTLIANEADPSARLTLGQNLTNNLKIVYSTNLADSNDQIWIVEYDLTRRFQARGVWQDDGSYRFDFRRDVRFGGNTEERVAEPVRAKVTDVSVTDEGGDESAVREKFRVKVGSTYDFFEIRNGIQRVEESLIEEGYLQSRVRLERQVEGQRAQLRLRVTRGPRVEVTFIGAMPPRRVERAVRAEWHRGVFDKQRGDDGVKLLREWLLDDNYLRAKVEYHIEDVATDRRRIVFQIEPGARSPRVVLTFEGASAINPGQLDRVVSEQKLERQLFTDPTVVTDVLERYYQSRGYLSATIDTPRFEFDADTARVVLPVREGPNFTVASIALKGNEAYDTDVLLSQISLVSGTPFVPAAAENALAKIRDLYWRKGFNDVRLDYDLVMNSGAGEVTVTFTVAEGRQSVIADVFVAGNERVSSRLVREQIQLMPAEPLDLGALARSRRRLYGTGAFSFVDITRRDADSARAAAAREVHLDVDVKEVPPWQLRYGASYDTERGVGVILDLSNRNSFGGARELGIRSRYDQQLRDVRFFINQPALTYRHETTLSVYFREELNPPTELTDPFDTSRKGMSIQRQQRLLNNYVWTYGYKIERAHTLTPTPVGIIDDAATVSPLTSTLTRETRDVVFDASKGAFLSQALSFSPSWLGSDQPYVKYFGQYFHYFPLQKPRQNPFTNEVVRPRLVFASGLRLGLAWGLDGDVPRAERFFAGGSATLRGFEQNTVGPITPEGFALGGQALFVLNNELRAPLISIVDGVFFADVGNVFGRVSALALSNLRQSAGIGLRIRTSWLLLRGDYGVVLDPRPGEVRGRFYLSIGQAF